MQEQQEQKTAHQPSRSRWAVLRSRQFFWREIAGLSALVFAFAVGATAIWWTVVTAKDGGMSSFPVIGPFLSGRGEIRQDLVAEDVPVYRRALDGLPMSAPEEGVDLVAVVIDNFTTARPQAGVADAPLVIEAPVESGITRLLAFFYADHGLDRIGPIRSARPYLVDWAEEYDAMFVHVGGSDAALTMLKAREIRDLNEFGAGAYFWRDRDRDAPHNAYTSAELLAAAERKRFDGKVSRPLASWEYMEETAAEARPEEGALRIGYANEEYAVEWRYLPAENAYERYQDGSRVVDEMGTPVRAKNVIVQYMKVRVIDDIGRREITTLGEGDMLAASNGTVIQGTWEHEERDVRTRLLGEDGTTLSLVPGTVWVEVVPIGTDVTH